VALHLGGLALLKQEQWIPTDPVKLTYLHEQKDDDDDDDDDEDDDAISYGGSITYLLLCYYAKHFICIISVNYLIDNLVFTVIIFKLFTIVIFVLQLRKWRLREVKS